MIPELCRRKLAETAVEPGPLDKCWFVLGTPDEFVELLQRELKSHEDPEQLKRTFISYIHKSFLDSYLTRNN